MGFFSNIFKSKPKPVVTTPLGDFTLIYSSKHKNTWINESKSDVLRSVAGTSEQPDPAQLKFLEKVETEIQKMDHLITKKFIEIFKEAGFDSSFKDWRQKFKIVAVDVMMVNEREAFWNICFETLEGRFAQFTIFIEGDKLTDFAMDT